MNSKTIFMNTFAGNREGVNQNNLNKGEVMEYPKMLYMGSKSNNIIVKNEFEEAEARKRGCTSHWHYPDEVPSEEIEPTTIVDDNGQIIGQQCEGSPTIADKPVELNADPKPKRRRAKRRKVNGNGQTDNN